MSNGNIEWLLISCYAKEKVETAGFRQEQMVYSIVETAAGDCLNDDNR